MNREDLLIEPRALESMIDDESLRLFDATVVFDPGVDGTGHERYLKRHLPGAAFLDHAAISDGGAAYQYTLPDETALASKIGALGISNDSKVVVYSSGVICWATRIWWVLRYAGHRNVRVLNGGLAGWQGGIEAGECVYPPTTFEPNYSPDMFANCEEVMKAAGDGSACVINTLTPELYRGEADSNYAGHIPGSINESMFELTDRDGFLLDEESLRSRFSHHRTDERIITYCGGGIAATTNACVAKMLGFDDVAVFDGSMTEWIGRGLPVTKGDAP